MKRKRKGIKKAPHLRTSKRGKKFRAGRGKRKIKIRRAARSYIDSPTRIDFLPKTRSTEPSVLLGEHMPGTGLISQTMIGPEGKIIGGAISKSPLIKVKARRKNYSLTPSEIKWAETIRGSGSPEKPYQEYLYNVSKLGERSLFGMTPQRKNFGMGYFEDPFEKQKIEKKLELHEEITGMPKTKAQRIASENFDEGYKGALVDLGLLNKGILQSRYGKPEKWKTVRVK